MKNCPSDYHGTPQDPYGCYEQRGEPGPNTITMTRGRLEALLKQAYLAGDDLNRDFRMHGHSAVHAFPNWLEGVEL